MRIGIGIDTGGTYTDAVLYDFENEEILGASKALTTKRDLTLGILEALDKLPSHLLKDAEILSLSTTLATNACVEDKGGRAKLIFLGVESAVVDRFGEAYGLPPSKDLYIQESFSKFSGEIEREPDWELLRAHLKQDFEGLEGVGIIEVNGVRNGGVIERKAKALVQQELDVPVVCAHELFGKINSLQRGASTLLNARLFPIIQTFMAAIRTSLQKRDITASIGIVRSDGSLMSERLANTRPVETLLCGPAASVMGSAFLGKEQDCLVVDMGGTTTDIALITKGVPAKVQGGISIGKWKTFVDGLYIKTIGLGGDTAVHYGEDRLYLEEYRVIPLCAAATQYPALVTNLKNLLSSKRKSKGFAYEHFILAKDIQDDPHYSDREKELCRTLEQGPLILKEVTEKAHQKGIYNKNLERLVAEGVIQVIGFTPTDAMHITGDFDDFCAEASVLAAEYIAQKLDITIPELCDTVYDEVKKKLYVNIVKVLFENKNSHYRGKDIETDIEYLVYESYEEAKERSDRGLFKTQFKVDYVLTGVGAPIHIFLDDVAQLLGTHAVLPPYHEVANALGAIVSTVFAHSEVEVSPGSASAGSDDYLVFGLYETKGFNDLDEAEAYAQGLAEEQAREEALRRGAQGEITVQSTLERQTFGVAGTKLFLSSKAAARAVGAMRL